MAATTSKLEQINALTGIHKLLAVVAQLRNPDGGCPWDLKQTHESLKPYVLEEAYELVEALNDGQTSEIQEELGDVLLQVVLHAQLAKDNGTFDFEAVSQGIADKLIRRHPHVFADTSVNSAEEVTQNWQAIKQAEKGGTVPDSILEGVPTAAPALSRALETSKRAVKVGFKWPSVQRLWQCVMSEYDEFRAEMDAKTLNQKRLEEEMGDILFASVNLAREFKIDPEVALTQATAKFTKRFKTMEAMAPKPLEELSFEEWDELWNQAKETVAKQQ